MTMFSEIFSKADRMEIITDFDKTPATGKFIGTDSSFLYIADGNNCIQAIALPHVVSCRTTSVEDMSEIDSVISHLENNLATPADEAISATTADGGILDEKTATAAATAATIGASGPAEENGTLTEIYTTEGNNIVEKEGLALTPRLSFPKVVGKIDLDSVTPRKRTRINYDENKPYRKEYPAYAGSENRQNRNEWRKDDGIWHLYPEAMGIVKRTGFKYGFVTNNEGEDMRYQGYNALDKLMPGDKVLFTTYEYPGHGTQIRSVVRVRSVGALLKKIERMDEVRDKMRIEDIVAQIKSSFPNNEEVRAALIDRWLIQEDDEDESPKPQPETKKQSANELKHVIKRMAASLLPNNYATYRITMAEMIANKKDSTDVYERNQVYDLYTSLIKNSYGRDERGRFIDEAVEYYRSLGEDVKAEYFERLKHTANRERTPMASEAAATSESVEGIEKIAASEAEAETTDTKEAAPNTEESSETSAINAEWTQTTDTASSDDATSEDAEAAEKEEPIATSDESFEKIEEEAPEADEEKRESEEINRGA